MVQCVFGVVQCLSGVQVSFDILFLKNPLRYEMNPEVGEMS